MKKKYLIKSLFLFFFLFSSWAKAVPHWLLESYEAQNLEISLYWYEPGRDLTSSWGHIALGILAGGEETIYNWGIFDMGPDVVKDFLKGKLKARVGSHSQRHEIQSYTNENRTIWRYPLKMTPEQKKRFQSILRREVSSENLIYDYHFFENNCATKIRDILFETYQEEEFLKWVKQKTPLSSLRLSYQGMPFFLNWGASSWLGWNTLKPLSLEKAMWHPEYLIKGLEGWKKLQEEKGEEPWIQEGELLYQGLPPLSHDKTFTFLLALCGAFLAFLNFFSIYLYSKKYSFIRDLSHIFNKFFILFFFINSLALCFFQYIMPYDFTKMNLTFLVCSPFHLVLWRILNKIWKGTLQEKWQGFRILFFFKILSLLLLCFTFYFKEPFLISLTIFFVPWLASLLYMCHQSLLCHESLEKKTFHYRITAQKKLFTKLYLTPPSVLGIRSLQENFHTYQNQAFGSRSPQFFALELAGECGELANLEKKAWRGQEIPPERLAEELADVVICAMNYANSRGIDLESFMEEKLKLIEMRRLEGRMGSKISS